MEENRRQSANVRKYPIKYSKFDISTDYGIEFNNNFSMNIAPYYLKTKFIQYYENKKTKQIDSAKFSDRKLGFNLKNKYKYNEGELIFGFDYENIYDKLSQGDKLGKKIYSAYFLQKHNFTDLFSLNGGYRFERALYDIKRPKQTGMIKRPAFDKSKTQIAMLLK